MRAIWTIAAKDLRLLLRDPRSAVILFLMPLVMILILGLALGDAFGQKPDDRIRLSVVVLDEGLPPSKLPLPDAARSSKWSDVVLTDFTDTGNIRVEVIPTREAAEKLVARGERSAVVIFEPDFSDKVDRCSFVGEPFKKKPINPLYRDGMKTKEIGITFLRARNQAVAASVIEQVVQVTLLRVIIPWMIGHAFEQIGTDEFMKRMEKHIPSLTLAYTFIKREKLGEGMQKGIGAFFSDYKFTAKTWSGLTNSNPPPKNLENRSVYEIPDNESFLKLNRGAIRYQILVPSHVVTFAFFLVLSCGWLFVAERRHGTLVRLRAAPLARWQILLGKFFPCLVISLFQAIFLLICGKLVFGMTWGPMPWLLLPVVASTSLAAVGLAMLVAGLSRTETQVAVYGTLLVLVLAGISGSLMPRDLMPEQMKTISLATPHAWALEAYGELLSPETTDPNLGLIFQACGILTGFGLVFLALAGWRLKLE